MGYINRLHSFMHAYIYVDMHEHLVLCVGTALWRIKINNVRFAGGIVFKVYVVGEVVKVLRRFSLPDVTQEELVRYSGVYQFPRVSCAAASAEYADLDPAVAGE